MPFVASRSISTYIYAESAYRKCSQSQSCTSPIPEFFYGVTLEAGLSTAIECVCKGGGGGGGHKTIEQISEFQNMH